MHLLDRMRLGPSLTCVVLVLLTACSGGGGGSSPPPVPPTAVAGAAQTVNKHAAVTLDGSGSRDPQGLALTYAWSQTGGTTVALSDATSARPTFTAPGVSGKLTFSLVV